MTPLPTVSNARPDAHASGRKTVPGGLTHVGGSARPVAGPLLPTDGHRTQALAAKRARRTVRSGLRSGEMTLRDVMRERPVELADAPLIDVIRMARVRRNGPAVQEIGRRAVRDGVNLMVPLGKASTASRAWVATNGTYRLYGARKAAR